MTKRRTTEFPPVPSQAFSLLGDVPVSLAPVEGCHGITHLDKRTITITPDQAPAQTWQTYWHEAVHVALWDAGVKCLPPKTEELICDVIGTYLAAAVRAGFLKVQDK